MTEREPKADIPPTIPETQARIAPADPLAAVEPVPAEAEHVPEPPDVNFAEYYHEARPRTLRHRARVRSTVRRRSVSR